MDVTSIFHSEIDDQNSFLRYESPPSSLTIFRDFCKQRSVLTSPQHLLSPTQLPNPAVRGAGLATKCVSDENVSDRADYCFGNCGVKTCFGNYALATMFRIASSTKHGKPCWNRPV